MLKKRVMFAAILLCSMIPMVVVGLLGSVDAQGAIGRRPSGGGMGMGGMNMGGMGMGGMGGARAAKKSLKGVTKGLPKKGARGGGGTSKAGGKRG